MTRASFAWSTGAAPTLHDIDINVLPGTLLAIVGQVRMEGNGGDDDVGVYVRNYGRRSVDKNWSLSLRKLFRL